MVDPAQDGAAPLGSAGLSWADHVVLVFPLCLGLRQPCCARFLSKSLVKPSLLKRQAAEFAPNSKADRRVSSSPWVCPPSFTGSCFTPMACATLCKAFWALPATHQCARDSSARPKVLDQANRTEQASSTRAHAWARGPLGADGVKRRSALPLPRSLCWRARHRAAASQRSQPPQNALRAGAQLSGWR